MTCEQILIPETKSANLFNCSFILLFTHNLHVQHFKKDTYFSLTAHIILERTEMEQDSTESRLTVDMGPETLDRVPEYRLKKRKQYQALKRKEKEQARLQKTKKATPTIQFKRAEHFLRAAKRSQRDSIRVHRNLRKLITNAHKESMKPVEDVKLVCVVRVRTADGIGYVFMCMICGT